MYKRNNSKYIIEQNVKAKTNNNNKQQLLQKNTGEKLSDLEFAKIY